MNTIYWTKKAIRQYRKIDYKNREKIDVAVDTLVDFSHASNVKPLKNHLYAYRLKAGHYRVLFNYDNGVQIVSIEEVKKRDDRTY
jgi:mRNA-degrading endonuclease RelE of RelBE toxin-antitoxin system